MSDQSTDGPVDPFIEEQHPEDLVEETASERIHELLSRYQRDGLLLTGWVLLTSWSEPVDDNVSLDWNVEPGQDWFRTLGILEAGHLKVQDEYLEPDEEQSDE